MLADELLDVFRVKAQRVRDGEGDLESYDRDVTVMGQRGWVLIAEIDRLRDALAKAEAELERMKEGAK